jgi:hypothetical protein
MAARARFLAGNRFETSLVILAIGVSFCCAQDRPGADVPWTTIEAEAMQSTGTVLGPKYDPHLVETESSGQRCVRLSSAGEYVAITAQSAASAMVVRYSLPDAAEGGGTQSTLVIYGNDKRVQEVSVTSRYSWLYGDYPFTNSPAAGKPRNFYDEVRVKDLSIAKGDVVRIERGAGGTADYCIIDLIDLENVAPPLEPPSQSVSIAGTGNGQGRPENQDYTEILRQRIAEAAATGKCVWLPPGTFRISGDIVVPSDVRIQGAGMWHTTLVGDEARYAKPDKRVRIIGQGDNIHLADFAIVGRLAHRNDSEANDGIVGSFGPKSTISRLWIEHTKIGVWVENCDQLTIEGCRFRDTIADGVNLCVGVTHSTVQNCTARGTGDDCFAMWPATYIPQKHSPGFNVIRHCSGQLPFLANGAALYGGHGNQVLDCLFTDITAGSAILISTTFPTADPQRNVDNPFSGTTVVQNCQVLRSGGFDHEWQWRAAVQLCLDRRSISGVRLSSLDIQDSLSDGLGVIAPGSKDGHGTLSDTSLDHVRISNCGIGTMGRHGLWIRNDVQGSLTVRDSDIPDSKNDSKDFAIH